MMTSILIALTGFACMGLFYQSYALRNARRLSLDLEETEKDLQYRIQQRGVPVSKGLDT